MMGSTNFNASCTVIKKKKIPKYNSVNIKDEVNSNSLRDDLNGYSHIFLITRHI